MSTLDPSRAAERDPADGPVDEGDAAPPAVPTTEDPEVSEADAVEQAAPVAPVDHVVDRELPIEADEADVAEQSLVVVLDEEDAAR